MTILLFSLLERFAVYDNEEGCVSATTEDISCNMYYFFVNTVKAAMWLMMTLLSSVIMRPIPAFCFGIQ